MKVLITTDWYAPVINGVVTSVKNLCRELERGNRFFQGDITCAACLYYLGLNKSYIEERQEQQILSQVDRYAICVADLWPVEG